MRFYSINFGTRQDISGMVAFGLQGAETAKMLIGNIFIGKQSINTNCEKRRLYI